MTSASLSFLLNLTQFLKKKREVGGGIGMGNTCKSMADSHHVWKKSLQYCKVISLQLIKIHEKKNSNSFLVLLVHNCFLVGCKPVLYTAVVPQKLCSILLAGATADHILFLNLILSVALPTVSPS